MVEIEDAGDLRLMCPVCRKIGVGIYVIAVCGTEIVPLENGAAAVTEQGMHTWNGSSIARCSKCGLSGKAFLFRGGADDDLLTAWMFLDLEGREIIQVQVTEITSRPPVAWAGFTDFEGIREGRRVPLGSLHESIEGAVGEACAHYQTVHDIHAKAAEAAANSIGAVADILAEHEKCERETNGAGSSGGEER